MAMTAEERKKARSDNRSAKLRSRYETIKWALVSLYDRARKEHWTHDKVLAYKKEWIHNDAYQSLPDWVKYKLQGVDEVLFDLTWRQLKVCCPHPDTGVVTKYDDLMAAGVEARRLDTDNCAMCFEEADGKLYKFN